MSSVKKPTDIRTGFIAKACKETPVSDLSFAKSILYACEILGSVKKTRQLTLVTKSQGRKAKPGSVELARRLMVTPMTVESWIAQENLPTTAMRKSYLLEAHKLAQK